jgi:ABC-type multidrug transport system permease subunit
MNDLKQLTIARMWMFLREPEAVFWVFLFPVVLALILGLAFRGQRVDRARVGVVEGEISAERMAALEAAEALRIVRFADAELLERKLRAGGVALRIQESGGDVVLRYDPTRPEAEMASTRVSETLQRAAGRVDVVAMRADPVTARGSRYIDFLIPGLLGMNLMSTGIWGSGFAVVDMRQKKLLKLLQATPMRRSRFLTAQMLSRLIFLCAEVTILTLFGTLVMGVPFRGGFVSFVILALLGGLCFTGIGLLIASRAQTIEGVSGLMNFVMMPMWLFSGVFFSYERFPEFFHPAIKLLPLTALNDGLRAHMLEGERLLALAGPIAVQFVWMTVTFAIAVRIFRWR